ncbi:MAG: ParA family protein [Oscillospiraceae bacterium]|nr:ParA family protein [Oscillospiraceae bacterium]
MAEVIAITNQKGGVGKTTTTLNFGAGLKKQGKRVLFVDMDPQCSLSYIMGGDCSGAIASTRDLLLNPRLDPIIAVQCLKEGDLICAHPGLSAMDVMLTQAGKEFRLQTALQQLAMRYDYIVIDSPPNLGILTVNILTASHGVIIPALADIFSLQGVGQLYSTIQAVKNYCNPGLHIYGILLGRHTDRFILHRSMRDMLEDTARQIETRVFKASIRDAVAVREAEAAQQSIFTYAPKSKQARDYEAFVDEFLHMRGAR